MSLLHSFCDGITSKVSLKVAREVVLNIITFSCGQEEAIKKKFGGLMPKKPPLISKVHF